MNTPLQETIARILADAKAGRLIAAAPDAPPPKAVSVPKILHMNRPVMRWVDTLWQDLLPRLEDPVRVTHTATTRQVDFLGQHVFMVDFRRRRVFLFERRGTRLHPLHDSIDLLRPVTLWVWLEVYVERAGVPPFLKGRVVAGLKGRVRKVVTLRELAARVRDALDLEAHPARMLALRSRPFKHAHRLLGLQFNAVWQNLEQFRQVERDNAGLLPLVLLGHLRGHFNGDVGGVAQLKAYLLERGITQAGWRLLAREGYDLVEQAIEYFTMELELTTAARYARTFAQAGATRRPPRAFVRAWLEIFAADIRLSRDWTNVPAHVLRTALRELGRCATPEAVNAFLPGFLAVDHWIVHGEPTFDANQRKLSWRSLVERAHVWQHLRAIEIECEGEEWRGLGGPWEIGDYRVEALRTARDLFLEGFHLRHCIHGHLDRCQTYRTAVYGVRHRHTGKHIATLEFRRAWDHWQLDEARVFGNRPAPADIRRLGEAIQPDIIAAWSALDPEDRRYMPNDS